MHIVENKSVSKKTGKEYHSILLRESYREGNKVKKRTIANLSNCNPKEIEAIRLALKHKDDLTEVAVVKESISYKVSRSVGAVHTVYEVAKELGIEQTLGTHREGKLAMWQIIARVLDQGSRLSAVRLAETHAACEILKFKRGFDENDLYRNLRYLSEKKEELELKMFNLRYQQTKPQLFLYDVTSTYLEGSQNELSAYGYNRDKKAGKKQIVAGLLCDQMGNPISVDIFKGNTQDHSTLYEQISKTSHLFGCEKVTFVGDRGMIKSGQIEKLKEYEFNYITAITKAQIGTLMKNNIVQLELFDEEVCEIEDNDIRYIMRKNPLRADAIEETRLEKQAVVFKFVEQQKKYLSEHPKAKVEVAIKKINVKLEKLGLGKWFSSSHVGRVISLTLDKEKLKEDSLLDGCYVLKTDLPSSVDMHTVHQRYKDLSLVELAFRTCKTDHLEMRPVYVRKTDSTVGHMQIVMFAYMIVQKLREAWKDFDFTVEEGIDQLKMICCHQFYFNDVPTFLKVPLPQESAIEMLDALGIQMPLYLPTRKVKVVTRKSLSNRS